MLASNEFIKTPDGKDNCKFLSYTSIFKKGGGEFICTDHVIKIGGA